MEKNKKRIRRIWWCVYLLACLAAGICTAAFDLSTEMTVALFLLLCLAAVLSWYVINLMWYRELNASVAAAAPLLHSDPDRYIAELTRLLGNKKSPQLRAVYYINLCAAYCEKQDWLAARAQLDRLRPQSLSAPLRACWTANRAYVGFYLGQNEAAHALLEKNAVLLQKQRIQPELNTLMEVLEVFDLCGQNQAEEAQRALDILRKKKLPGLDSDIKELQKRLEQLNEK